MHQEINVIGQRAEEARDAVDEFLDRAVMATASRVRIVHGHGMGVLKKMIAGAAGHHPHVARFYPAPQQEGGAGRDHCGVAGVRQDPASDGCLQRPGSESGLQPFLYRGAHAPLSPPADRAPLAGSGWAFRYSSRDRRMTSRASRGPCQPRISVRLPSSSL